MKIFLKDIKKRFPQFEILNYNEEIYFENFNHDSRVEVKNSLFIPIVGENFDGHNYVTDAFENGSVISLFQRDHLNKGDTFEKPIIIVDEIESGLEKIVSLVMENIHVPVVAITGSTGKTMTREMVGHILSVKGSVLRSDKNYNTLWGNAQLLCSYKDQEYVVLEFGMDRKGEIASQCRAIDPDIGAIVNVGYVHAEKLGGIESVYEAKKELADYLNSLSKSLVLNIDDERLNRIPSTFKGQLVKVGVTGTDYVISNISVNEDGTSFTLTSGEQEDRISLPVLGNGYAYNATIAIAMASLLGVSIGECKKRLLSFPGFKGRFEIKKISETLTIIDDAYNANPTSMQMSLNTFESIWGSKSDFKRVLILGDMKELGEVSGIEHRKIGEIVKDMNVENVYYVGEYFNDFGVGERLDDAKEALDILNQLKVAKTPTVVLLKASHSIGLGGLEEKL